MPDNQGLTSKELDEALDNLADLSHCDLLDIIEAKDNLILNLEEQLTVTQQALNTAVEALRFTDSAIMQLKEIPDITKLHVDKWCLDGRAYLKAALVSIKE